MNKEEIKIITLGDIFDNLETEEQAFKFLKYIKNQQQELDKYKNIVDEIKKDLYNILHNLEKYDETAGYVPEHLEYATNYTEQAIDKLKELKGE